MKRLLQIVFSVWLLAAAALGQIAQQPNNVSAGFEILQTGPNKVVLSGVNGDGGFNPLRIGSLAAYYDFTDTSSLKVDASNRVSYAADKSGNSAVMGLVLPGTSGNNASFAALTAFGTNDFTVSAQVNPLSLAATGFIFGAASNGFGLKIETTGKITSSKASVADNTSSSGSVGAFGSTVVTYVRSGTTGTYYIGGVASGTTTDNQNYSVGVSFVGALNSTTAVLNGIVNSARVYSAALTPSQVAADAAGTVQANCVFDMDFTAQARGAAGPFTSGTRGGASAIAVTLNTSGDLGARICGARDLAQLTGSKQPQLLPWSGANYLYCPNVASNGASTPDQVALRLTNAMSFVMRYDMLAEPGSLQVPISKFVSTVAGYEVTISSSGNGAPGLIVAGGGANTSIQAGSTTFVDKHWLRWDFTRDTGGGNYKLQVFYSTQTITDETQVTWVQLGSDLTGASPTVTAETTQVFSVGQRNDNSLPFNGRIYYVGVRATFAGALIAKADASQAAHNAGSWLSSTGEIWNVVPGQAKILAGSGGLALSGTAGNYGSSPSAAPLNITGDIDVRAFAAPTSWTPAANNCFASKWDAGGTSWIFNLNATGLLSITWNDGVGNLTATASTATGLSGNAWVRFTLKVDNGAAGNTTTFYTSPDAIVWTQLGTTVVKAGTTAIASTAGVLRVGARDASGATDPFAGNILRAQIYNGIAGTLVFDANFAAAARDALTFTESSTNAATVTVNRTAGSAKPAQIVGRQSLLFDGTSWYMKAPPFALNQPTTVVLVGKQNVWTGGKVVFDGSTNQSIQVAQITSTPRLQLYSGSAAITNDNWLVGINAVLEVTANNTASLLRVNRGAGTTGTTGTNNPSGFTLAADGSVTTWSAIQASRVFIFSTALDTPTLNQVGAWSAAKDLVPNY